MPLKYVGFTNSSEPSFFISSCFARGVRITDDDSILSHFRMSIIYFFCEINIPSFVCWTSILRK